MKLQIYSFPIAGLFIMHGWSYLTNPSQHLAEQRDSWLLIQDFAVAHIGLPYIDNLAFFSERIVFLLGVWQILCGVCIILQDRLMIIYSALYWNMAHIVLDNPALTHEPKYLYYENFFPNLYANAPITSLEGFDYDEYYWDRAKVFVVNLIIVCYLWFLGFSYDAERARGYLLVGEEEPQQEQPKPKKE